MLLFLSLAVQAALSSEAFCTAGTVSARASQVVNTWLKFALVLALVCCAGAAIGHSNAAVPDDLFRRDVQVVTTPRRVDPAVLAALARFFAKDSRPASREEPFSAKDAGPGPSRWFVLAAEVPTLWFIHYEHSGIGRHSHLVAFRRWGNSWRLAYAGIAPHTFTTLDRLRNAIRTHQFRQNMSEF
jgi:hypothetical protein